MNKQAYFKLMGLIKRAQRKSWDPDYIPFNDGDPYQISTDKIDQTIQNQLKKYYARLLAQAYKRATGKNLSDPQKHINPRFNYIIGRAGGIDPKILEKLNDYDYGRLGGWQRSIYSPLQPGLIADAVDHYNWNKGRHIELLSGKQKKGPKLRLALAE